QPRPLPMGGGALVALSHLRFTELLRRSAEVLAIAVLFKIDAMALRDPPLRGLDELGLPGNIIAEAARGPAAFETSAHEEAVRDCAGEAGLLFVTGNRFVDATLIVGLATNVSTFGHDFLALRDPGVLIARDPINARAHDPDYEHNYDNHDYQ